MPGSAVTWTEPPLFEGDGAHARHTDPATSHEAAATVRVSDHRRWVLAIVDAIGPLDDESLVRFITTRALPLTGQSARSRRAELTREGYIERCGDTRTAAGRRAYLWRTTATGHQLAIRVGKALPS